MIPYIPQPELNILGANISSFIFFVILSIIVSYILAIRRARNYGLNTKVISNILDYMIPIAIVLSAFFQTIWYHPDSITLHNWYKLKTWAGISSFGGFLGAALFLWFYFARKSTPKFMDYADTLIYALAGAWFVARIGCFFAHDHPGAPSDFILAINYPEGILGGVTRHNLGLYEALYSLIIFLYLQFGLNKTHKQGWPCAIVCMSYSVVRFFLDSLRAVDLPGSDARYFSLTPAQWSCFVLFALGIYYYLYSRRASTPYITLSR